MATPWPILVNVLYLHWWIYVFVFVFVWTYSAHCICGDTLDKIFGVTVDKYELIQKSEAVAISIWVRDKHMHCYGNTWEFDKKKWSDNFLGVRLPICLGTSSKQFNFCSNCSWRSCVIESFLHKKKTVNNILPRAQKIFVINVLARFSSIRQFLFLLSVPHEEKNNWTKNF